MALSAAAKARLKAKAKVKRKRQQSRRAEHRERITSNLIDSQEMQVQVQTTQKQESGDESERDKREEVEFADDPLAGFDVARMLEEEELKQQQQRQQQQNQRIKTEEAKEEKPGVNGRKADSAHSLALRRRDAAEIFGDDEQGKVVHDVDMMDDNFSNAPRTARSTTDEAVAVKVEEEKRGSASASPSPTASVSDATAVLEIVSKTALSKLKVVELRDVAKKRGVDTDGTKPILVSRILAAQEEQQKQPQPQHSEMTDAIIKAEDRDDGKKTGTKRKLSASVERVESVDLLAEFARIRNAFSSKGDVVEVQRTDGSGTTPADSAMRSADEFLDALAADLSVDRKVSNRQRRQTMHLGIAVLKQLVARPDLVEAWDVNAADPTLLLHLKGYRHAVPVPRHWTQPGKYLQHKRGTAHARYNLPDYIEATGIAKVRGAMQEEEEGKSMKQTQRSKLLPRMHRMDIDYQVLHDAFFRFQTKPPLLGFGDAYFEEKESDSSAVAASAGSKFRPGLLSPALREALGMPSVEDEAASGTAFPPPWLVNMQRVGPPPSYPQLRVPGVNAPLPAGASWGFHAGGWGRPPLDAANRPLFGGDPLGLFPASTAAFKKLPEKYALWGALDEEEWEDEGAVSEEFDEGGLGEDETAGQRGVSTYGGYGLDDVISDEDEDFDFALAAGAVPATASGLSTPGFTTPSMTVHSLRKQSGTETPLDASIDASRLQRMQDAAAVFGDDDELATKYPRR